MKNKKQTFEVYYTKKNGDTGSILVKAENKDRALLNARNLCATGKEFRNPVISNKEYIKPKKQGFAGYN